jgi:hypothetical protein
MMLCVFHGRWVSLSLLPWRHPEKLHPEKYNPPLVPCRLTCAAPNPPRGNVLRSFATPVRPAKNRGAAINVEAFQSVANELEGALSVALRKAPLKFVFLTTGDQSTSQGAVADGV